jgi:hypothetical protein
MDLVTEFIAVLLIGLSLILAGIAGSAAARYSDSRLGLVAIALGAFAVVGVLAFLHEISPRYGGPYEVDQIPLGILVVAVALLYAALVRQHRPAPSS